ncbi:MAG: hypothetical protein WC150_02445 [Bacteroidia bacterium]
MNDLKLKFKDIAAEYLNMVNKENFENMYEGFVLIIYQFKNDGISKNDIGDAVLEIMRITPDRYKREILQEMLNRLYGNCPPFYLIEDW